MGDWVSIQCPYCFEWLEIFIELDLEGHMVRDCEVCCRPWQLRVHRDTFTGELQVHATRG